LDRQPDSQRLNAGGAQNQNGVVRLFNALQQPLCLHTLFLAGQMEQNTSWAQLHSSMCIRAAFMRLLGLAMNC
jgi:hypothetical protein